jgi:hypothetical protein
MRGYYLQLLDDLDLKDGYDNNLVTFELTDEELSKPITYDDLDDLTIHFGENLFDSLGDILNTKKMVYQFIGYVVHKYPQYSKEFFTVGNSYYPCLTDLMRTYEHIWRDTINRELNNVEFYTDFAEFINLNHFTLHRMNILIKYYLKRYGDKNVKMS